MPCWNGDPSDFKLKDQSSALAHIMDDVNNMTVKNHYDVPLMGHRGRCFASEVQKPSISFEDQQLDENIKLLIEQEKERERKIQAAIAEEEKAMQEQIEREWANVPSINVPFAQVVEGDTEISYTITTTANENDGWLVVYPDGTTSKIGGSDEEEIIEEEPYISVSEFKDFIYELIQEKGGALPDIDDWKRIKNMLDFLPEDDYVDDEDEWYYGCNESEILVGDAEEPVSLYHNGACKFQTTYNGVQINNPDIGDFYYDINTMTMMVWTGTQWQDESHRG